MSNSSADIQTARDVSQSLLKSQVPQRTALYQNHLQLGAKITDFAGWEMPVWYEGLIAEHHAVRTSVGIFDVSHMGEIEVCGTEAAAALNYVTCNDVNKLVNGKGQYSALLNEQGGVIDDVIVYRITSDRFFLCVNASNCEAVYNWLKQTISASHNRVTVEDVSDSCGQVALQGPRAWELLESLQLSGLNTKLPYFGFQMLSWQGIDLLVARTGYTGEDGVEIFAPTAQTADLWEALIKGRSGLAAQPCGLGARDTLRLEACYPLHGHELGEVISAIESGLGWIVKWDKGDFIGRSALLQQQQAGTGRKLVAFGLTDPGIARADDIVVDNSGNRIGIVTSGSKTPTLGRAIGLALVNQAQSAIGDRFSVLVRGRSLSATVENSPFYSALRRKPVLAATAETI